MSGFVLATPDRRPALQLLFQARHAAEFVQGCGIVSLEQRFLIHGCNVLDGDFNPIHCTENVAAKLFQLISEILNFLSSSGEEGMKPITKCSIVRRERGQYSRVVNGLAQRRFQLPYPWNDA